jgi:hypothetical protein
VPEVPPLAESATYEVRVESDRVVLELLGDINVKGPATDARLTLPAAGFLEALSDRGPAPVVALQETGKSGRITLLFTKAGRYRIAVRYILVERGDRARRIVEFPVLGASSTRLSASSAASGAEFLLSAGSGSPDEPLAPATWRPVPASAFARLTVKTRAGLPVTREKAVIIAETLDVVRPERERVFVRTLLKVAVSRAEVAGIPLVVPPGSEVISVAGPDEPPFEIDPERSLVILKPEKPFSGERSYSVLFWRKAPPEGEPIEVVPVRVADAASSRGFLVVVPTSIRDQVPVTIEGLTRTDVVDLPAFARPFAASSARAYRVTAPGARLVLKAPIRQTLSPTEALLVEARLLTVFGDGGSRLDRSRFLVETRRPWFTIPIEADEDVQSVSVDGVSVRPQNDGGSLLVVLPASTAARRVIDVTTKRRDDGPPKKGEFTVSHGPLPVTAAITSWTIVLPEDRRYLFVSSTGIRKIGWAADSPAQASRFQPESSSWLATLGGDVATVALQVRDPYGQLLPGVSVQLREVSQNGSLRAAQTDASGSVVFEKVPASEYIAEASLAGFKQARQKVRAAAGSVSSVSMKMDLDSRAEMTVTSDSPAVSSSRQVSSNSTTRSVGPTEQPKAGGGAMARPQQSGEAEGGVQGGIPGGVLGGALGGAPEGPQIPTQAASPAKALERSQTLDGVGQAGIRSLPMEVIGHGKRLSLSGPLVGSTSISVTLKAKGL